MKLNYNPAQNWDSPSNKASMDYEGSKTTNNLLIEFSQRTAGGMVVNVEFV